MINSDEVRAKCYGQDSKGVSIRYALVFSSREYFFPREIYFLSVVTILLLLSPSPLLARTFFFRLNEIFLNRFTVVARARLVDERDQDVRAAK